MYNKINEQIQEIKEKQRDQSKLLSKQGSIKESLLKERVRFKELKAILDKEGTDVQKLEGLSLTGLFHSILGNKHEQMKKEKQEYLAVKLKYDECMHTVDTLENEKKAVNTELSKYMDLDREYENLLITKEQLLLKDNSALTKELIDLSELYSEVKADQKEIKEAIAVGNKAQGALDDVRDSLQSAKNWGTWDMFGGGLLSTMAKHSKIDDAKNTTYYAQDLLRSFNRELKDVHLSTNIEINLSSFDKFADYFFDGLISDWIVQSKINQSLSNVQDVSYQVEQIIKNLEDRLTEVSRQIDVLNNKITTFIENA